MNNIKNTLFVGDGRSIHTITLANNLKSHNKNQRIEIFDICGAKENSEVFDQCYNYNIIRLLSRKPKLLYIARVFFSIALTFLKDKNKYNSVQLHFLGYISPETAKLFKRKTTNLVAVFWGSDLFRTTNLDKLKRVISFCDTVHFSTNDMEVYARKKLGNALVGKKIIVNKFGVTGLDYLKEGFVDNPSSLIKFLLNKKREGKKLVTVGYNAFENQQHIAIIKQLKNNANKDEYYFIFPMGYGRNEEYLIKVDEELATSGLDYKVLNEYFDNQDNANITLITDIFIQLQVTDALSAAMQEHIYSGSNTITGSWLPYQDLDNAGVKYTKISSIDKLNTALSKIEDLSQMERVKNKEAIYMMSSWSSVIGGWDEI
ncbi:hypothetical protein NB571_01370 [Vibrio parahaemolyticus]|uniref:hypothetical protein n=1 Tax=Vibrio parahaemolyticus TaxID=670 RepID=UPI00215C70E9|nr:hypothetical protein [Vibrio parahaemolyticus]MCS0049298.1 hypothetical protein [Vibrio parahaemolyticus]